MCACQRATLSEVETKESKQKMNNFLKLSLQALGVGVLTMAIGVVIIKGIRPEQQVKPLLLPLFITGVVLFALIEITGMHKKFCIAYLKQ